MKSDSIPKITPEVQPHSSKLSAPAECLDVTQLIGQLLSQGEMDIYRKVCLEVDRAVMQVVLRHTKGNQGQACKLLGISRTTLRSKLRRLRVAVEKKLSPVSDSV